MNIQKWRVHLSRLPNDHKKPNIFDAPIFQKSEFTKEGFEELKTYSRK